MEYLLEWEKDNNALKYKIERKLLGNDYELIAETEDNFLPVTVSNNYITFRITGDNTQTNSVQYKYYPYFQNILNGIDIIARVRAEIDRESPLSTFTNQTLEVYIDQAIEIFYGFVPKATKLTISTNNYRLPESAQYIISCPFDYSFDLYSKEIIISKATLNFDIVYAEKYVKTESGYKINYPNIEYYIKDLVLLFCLETILNNLFKQPDIQEGLSQIKFSATQKELTNKTIRLRQRIFNSLSTCAVSTA